MAAKRTGISRDLIIHPGETIADILEERGITQAELAARTNVTPAYISKVISGKNDISPDFARKLEYALDVPKTFWLNRQASYDAELLEWNEANTVTKEECAALQILHEVVAWLAKRKMITQQADDASVILELRRVFRMSDISKLGEQQAVGAFRVAKTAPVEPLVMGAWLRLCQVFGECSTADVERFDPQKTGQLIAELKQLMVKACGDPCAELTEIMARYGIRFSVMPNFRGAPVHGYISRNKEGEYQMALTLRGAGADIFWFSLFHELGHIVNGDVSKTAGLLDTEDSTEAAKEEAANDFAKDALLEPASYASFVKGGSFGADAICQYAKSQNVAPYIVIGRLQKETLIPYSWHSKYKTRYKWAE